VLVTLIEAYEEKHHPIGAPDPVQAIKFRMEQMGLTRNDLEPLIGKRWRVSEVLNKKRPLSLTMIRHLNEKLGIPAEVLMGPCVAPRVRSV
jgi:HTH-type transcriptional regulator / antitoxin HigA